ncbi:MAG: hypothetical protein HC796_10480 [Synechococcaceae cyanobacterium RL_1_2]|nr:hypothetical protein [Synechococcaceae cyanobacterium RL_1_2]
MPEHLTSPHQSDLPLTAYLPKPIKQSQLFNIVNSMMGEEPLPDRGSNSSHKHGMQFDQTLGETIPLKILIAEDNAVNQKVAVNIF